MISMQATLNEISVERVYFSPRGVRTGRCQQAFTFLTHAGRSGLEHSSEPATPATATYFLMRFAPLVVLRTFVRLAETAEESARLPR